jgi:hypothetical protein
MTENEKPKKRLLIVGCVVLLILALIMAAVAAGILLFTDLGSRVGLGNVRLGGSKVNFPRVSSSKNVEMDEDEVVDILYNETPWPLPVAMDYEFYWTEKGEDLVQEELESMLKKGGWDQEQDWDLSQDVITGLWEKDNRFVRYYIWFDVDDAMLDDMDSQYEVNVGEGSTVVLAVGWEEDLPAQVGGPGWGICEFPKSDLNIACLEDLPGVGEYVEYTSNNWEMETFFAYIFEIDDEEALEEEIGVRIDFEEPLDEIMEEVLDVLEYDYKEEDLITIRTGAGKMRVVLFEDSANEDGVFGIAMYEDIMILYEVMLQDAFDEDVQYEFHQDLIRSISQD